MNNENLEKSVDGLSDADRERILSACWYVAYADGRLYREAKLLQSIARRLRITVSVSKKLKKQVATGKRRPELPNEPESRHVMLSLLLQVATNDGRFTVADQSAIRRLGKLAGLDDAVIEGEISKHVVHGDGVKPISSQKLRQERSNSSTRSSDSSNLEAELQNLVQPDPSVPKGQANPLIGLAMILLANFIPVLGVLLLDWRVFPILVVFWIENIIIGFVNVLKMSATPVRPGGQGMPPLFFLVHYGGFCFGHGIFIFMMFYDQKWLTSEVPETPFIQIGTLLLCIFVIVVEHAWLLFRFMAARQNERTTRDRLILEPYGRVVAVHVTILLGAYIASVYDQMAGVLLMLLGIKTCFDAIAWAIDLPRFGHYGRLRQACKEGAFAALFGGMAGFFVLGWPASAFGGDKMVVVFGLATALAVGIGVWSHRMLQGIGLYKHSGGFVQAVLVGGVSLTLLVLTAVNLNKAIIDFSIAEKAAVERKREAQLKERQREQRLAEDKANRRAEEAKRRLEENRKANPPLEVIKSRPGTVNLALNGKHYSNERWGNLTADAENAGRAFDGDPSTVWESSPIDRSGQARLTIQWDDPVTLNKIVLIQKHDRLVSFRLHVLEDAGEQWTHVWGLNGPKHHAPFFWADRGIWASKKGAVEIDGQWLSKQKDRVIGGEPDSLTNNTFTIYFPHPIETKGLQLHIRQASKNPVKIAEFEVY